MFHMFNPNFAIFYSFIMVCNISKLSSCIYYIIIMVFFIILHVQAWILSEIETPSSESKNENEHDLEFEAAKVEVGDTFVVIIDELDNGDPFYFILCNKALYRCEETFEDDQGNTYYTSDMILRGLWYYKTVG